MTDLAAGPGRLHLRGDGHRAAGQQPAAAAARLPGAQVRAEAEPRLRLDVLNDKVPRVWNSQACELASAMYDLAIEKCRILH